MVLSISFRIVLICLLVLWFGEAGANASDRVILAAPKPLASFYAILNDTDRQAFKPVGDRIPEDYIMPPVRWRGLEIYPLLDSSQSVNTNIFATESDEETDTITTLAPSVTVNGAHRRHQFSFETGAELKKYWSNTDESVLNFDTKFRSLIEARHDIRIPFEIGFSNGHENRRQNLSPNFARKPIGFKTFGTALGLSYNPNRLTVSGIGRYSAIAFDNGTNRAGQAVIRDDGDSETSEVELRAAYALLPNHQPYVTVTIGQTEFDRNDHNGTGYNGLRRDSTHRSMIAGWQFSYKGLLNATLGAGFESRDYDSPQIQDLDTARFAGDLNWNITKKATFNLGFARLNGEDNQIVQGAVLTRFNTALDYEILHNLYYNAALDYTLADFEGIIREDDNLALSTGLRYLMSPRFALSASYGFDQRDSNVAGSSFDQHEVMVRLHTKF